MLMTLTGAADEIGRKALSRTICTESGAVLGTRSAGDGASSAERLTLS